MKIASIIDSATGAQPSRINSQIRHISLIYKIDANKQYEFL